MSEHEYTNSIFEDSDSYEENDTEEYFLNHHPSYYTGWDDYVFARSLDPERFEEYELNNAIKHNMFCPDH